MTIPFTKMHGLGNDFIVLDQRQRSIDDLPAFAKTYCDRRFGIGAGTLAPPWLSLRTGSTKNTGAPGSIHSPNPCTITGACRPRRLSPK